MSIPTTTVPYTINNVTRVYSVKLEAGLNWDKSLSSILINNTLGKQVYAGVTNGNRVAILVNTLWLRKLTKPVEHNGVKYIYIQSMDILVSKASKKVVWTVKTDPQRKAIIALVN